MKHRNAATLVEVLVAIFVMAIGLLALLTLFPLGALRMRQAIQDDRTAHAAANAAAFAEARRIRQDTQATAAMANPYSGAPLAAAAQVLPNLNLASLAWDGPSYPVYLDPVGRVSHGSTWTGNLPASGIPRRSGNFATTLALAFRNCALLDDIEFGPNGTPLLAGSQVERQIRYSWAYMVRRPRFQEPSAVELTVVVYSGRSYQLIVGEQAYQNVRFDTTRKDVVVSWNPAVGQEKPRLRRGTWVLDATTHNPFVPLSPPVAGQPNLRRPDPHGFFYRVAEVNELPGNQLAIELETYPRLSTIHTDTMGQRPYGVLVVLDNVVEVFEKGLGWKP